MVLLGMQQETPMTNHQRSKRRLTWALTAILFVIFHGVLLIGPAVGGLVTAEQPAGVQHGRQ